MNFARYHHVLRAPEDGSGGGAAGGAGAAAGDGAGAAAAASTASAAGAAGAASGAAAAGGTALGAGASAAGAGAAQGAQAAAADPVWGRIPEKFRVTGADGKPDLSASWDKVEDHRGNLERRMGAGEAPPKEATDYKVNVPEALKDAIKSDELAASDKFKEFTAEMHKAGLSQKQFDQVVGKMLDYSIGLQQGSAALSEADCTKALRGEWKDDSAYTAGVRSAYRAAEAYGDVNKLLAKYGNDPDFIRFASNVGKELGEDTSAGAAALAMSDTDIEALQKSPAYWNAADPQHAAVKAKVEAHYAAKFGTGAKSSGSISIGSVR